MQRAEFFQHPIKVVSNLPARIMRTVTQPSGDLGIRKALGVESELGEHRHPSSIPTRIWGLPLVVGKLG